MKVLKVLEINHLGLRESGVVFDAKRKEHVLSCLLVSLSYVGQRCRVHVAIELSQHSRTVLQQLEN